jgi:hypothetical protein
MNTKTILDWAARIDGKLDHRVYEGMNMSEHTPGKLLPPSYDCNGLALIGPSPNYTIASVWHTPERDDQEANARRLVACWNALEDLPQDALDGGWTRAGLEAYGLQMKAERDRLSAINAELIEALKLADKTMEEISKEMTAGERYTNAGQYLLDTPAVVRAAIAKAQGEQT